MSHMPSRQELDSWLAQASKSIRAAATRADALAIFGERRASIATWHPAVAKAILAKLAAVGKAKFKK